ncbi:retrovirus-related pol polyprotein from transposon TNT 1-94 [Tanacetum coccineum]|uniref:Retrovirus-related pol polyprotein from transposon TNT 1-94 n=1 Tax=Tanacetum coccineum TaxID=301880 RepID=A0ABQ5ADK1_9ASTR
MDLCGPMRTESINGKKYVLVIVDDYTRFGWVRFLRTKDETPQVIEKFIVKTQRALNATVRFVRTDNGTEFVNKTLDGWFESVGISHETSVPRSPQQNGIVERRNRTLMEAARTMLIFAKAPLFLWAEAVATACYTLNRSLETVHVAFDELTEGLTSVQTSSGLAPQQMTSVPNSTELELTALQSGRSRSALVKDPEPPSVPPTKKQVDDLFQWFDDDEVVPIPPVVPITPVNVPAAPAPENANGSPSTTVISEGAPAVTESLLPHQIPLPDTSDSDVETLFDHVDSNVFDTYNAPETDSEASSSNSVNIDVTPNNQLPHVQKWTQAHPLENIIGDKDRPVSTRKQLETDAMWCFFNEFLTHVEPKTYKQALEHSCWIETVLEEQCSLVSVKVIVRILMDMKTAFSTANYEVVYVSQLKDLLDPEHPSHVDTDSRKALYGLKHAPRDDDDLAGCHDTRRSTSGSAQFLGHRLVSWSSKKQKSTAISTYGVITIAPIQVAVLKSSDAIQTQSMDLRSTKIPMSKGRTVADSIAERLTRPTAYKFKTDCSIIPVWDTSGIEKGESLGNLILSPFGGFSDIRSSGVDGPPVMPEDPYAYVVAAFQAPPSPDYVPGPEYPPLPVFVQEQVYPEFMPPEEEVLPGKEQPLLLLSPPTAEFISGYEWIGDNGNDEDESSDEDEDDEDVDIEGEEEEEEHPAPTDSKVVVLPAVDEPPIPFWSDTEVAKLLAIPTPPPSPLSPWSSPLPQIPSPPLPLILSPLPVSPPLPVSSPPPASPIRPLRFFYDDDQFELCTDISKITRKQSKTGKHGHENQKSTKRSQRIKAEARKVKPAVKSSQHGQQKVNQ